MPSVPPLRGAPGLLRTMLAALDWHVPVMFLNIGKLFPETLVYRDVLVARLGLTDLQSARPELVRLARVDPEGQLRRDDSDLCCWDRKVEPLETALSGFAAWITGRKRMHGGRRAALDLIEPGLDGRIKLNPLADWGEADIERISPAMICHGIPGWRTATAQSAVSPAPRRPVSGSQCASAAGRGVDKTECGIRLARQMMMPKQAAGSVPA
jgi:phosphoadenosine phosphosulfate reductase